MDALVLIGSFAALMLLGMPVAYALGLAALLGGLWIDLPLDAIMIALVFCPIALSSASSFAT